MKQEFTPWAEQVAYDRKKAAELAAASEQCGLFVSLLKADLDYAVEQGLISQENRDEKKLGDFVAKVFGAYFNVLRKEAIEAEERRRAHEERAAQAAHSADDFKVSISVKRQTAETLRRYGFSHDETSAGVGGAVVCLLAAHLRIRRDGDGDLNRVAVSKFLATPNRTDTGGLRINNTAREFDRI